MPAGEAETDQEPGGAAPGDGQAATPGGTAGTPAAAPAAPAAPAPGSPSIRIQMLDGNQNAQPVAPAPPPARPRLDVSVAPVHTRESALQEGLDHEGAAQRAKTGGELGAARAEYLEAARIFRLVAQRGGRDAGAARQRLAVCERVLGVAR